MTASRGLCLYDDAAKAALGGDPVEIAERVGEFQQRAFYYYENWERLYDQWKVKMNALIGEATRLIVGYLTN